MPSTDRSIGSWNVWKGTHRSPYQEWTTHPALFNRHLGSQNTQKDWRRRKIQAACEGSLPDCFVLQVNLLVTLANSINNYYLKWIPTKRSLQLQWQCFLQVVSTSLGFTSWTANAQPYNYQGDQTWEPTPIYSGEQLSNLVAVQAFIWIPILLIIITGCTVCTMMSMDADKSKDTLVYAKFLANVKDKWDDQITHD